MEVFVLKVDSYHEPTYFGFATEKDAFDYAELHILRGLLGESEPDQALLDAFKDKRYRDALSIWADSEAEYLTVFSLDMPDVGELKLDLAMLKDKFYLSGRPQ